MNRELMKDFLRESFPNPERKGCPDEDTLQALAEDRLSPNDPALLHVGSCSECYNEYLHYRQDFEEASTVEANHPVPLNAPFVSPHVPVRPPNISFMSRRRPWLFAAVAAIVIVVGGSVLYVTHPIRTNSPSAALVASSKPVDVQIDLFNAVTTRGIGDGATPIKRVMLPAAVIHLRVTLPRFSETGEYTILVSKDRAGRETVAKSSGSASEQNGRACVPVILDLRSASPGAYFLATVRGSDNGTYYYPLQVH